MEVLLRPKVGVGVYVLRGNQILLGERIASHGAGTWCAPGGHLEFGETPFECAQRELKEETGLIAQKIVPGSWTNEVFPLENKHYVTINMFVTKFVGEPVDMEPEKMCNWQWFDRDKLPSSLFLSMKNFLKEQSFPKL